MRLVLALILVAGCGDDRATKCQQARDRMIPQQEELVRKTLEAVPPEQAAKLRVEADAEIAHFKARFVDACKRAKVVDFKCFEHLDSQSKDCRKKHDPIWEEVYRQPPAKQEQPADSPELVTPIEPSKDCVLARDKLLAITEKQGERALQTIPANAQADARAEMAKDLATIRSKFIPACEREKLAAACLDEEHPEAVSDECKTKLRAIKDAMF